MPEHSGVQQLYERLHDAWAAIQGAKGEEDSALARAEFDRLQSALHRIEVGTPELKGAIWHSVGRWGGPRGADPARIADAVQDAWTSQVAYELLFRERRRSYRGYLVTCAKNLIRDGWDGDAPFVEDAPEELELAGSKSIPSAGLTGVRTARDARDSEHHDSVDSEDPFDDDRSRYKIWVRTIMGFEKDCLRRLHDQPPPQRQHKLLRINAQRVGAYLNRAFAFTSGSARERAEARQNDYRHARGAVVEMRACLRTRLAQAIAHRRLDPPLWPTPSVWDQLIEARLGRVGGDKGFGWKEQELAGWDEDLHHARDSMRQKEGENQ